MCPSIIICLLTIVFIFTSKIISFYLMCLLLPFENNFCSIYCVHFASKIICLMSDVFALLCKQFSYYRMCSLCFKNNLLTIEVVHFASISKKATLSKLSFAFVLISLPLLAQKLYLLQENEFEKDFNILSEALLDINILYMALLTFLSIQLAKIGRPSIISVDLQSYISYLHSSFQVFKV